MKYERHYTIAMVAACPFPCARGTPIRIYRMAEALGRLGHCVHVITYHLGEPCETDAFHIHRIKPVFTYRKISPGPSYQKLLVVDLLLASKLSQILRSHEFDVIHAHHYEGLMVALIANRNRHLPVIYDAHTLLESELPYYSLGWSKSIKKRLGHFVDSWLPDMASGIIAVADDIRNKLILEHGVNAEKIVVIPNGVECEHFVLDNPPDSSPTNREHILVYAGNLGPFQGIEHLLQIFHAVLQQRSDVRLRIITNGDFKKYQPLAESLGIHNHIAIEAATFDELPEFLNQADVALNPRIECDGLPQKLLNYMAAGKAIVSFAGSAKLLQHEETGLIIKDGEIRSFANAVIRLLDNPDIAVVMGKKAQQFVQEKHGWNSKAKKIMNFYTSMLLEKENKNVRQ